jgi:ketosteroid isomerase-like protein
VSQENVEIVRAIYEAVERRDWDRAFRDQHPDVELTTPPGIDAGTYRGRAEIQRFWEEWFGVFEERSSAHAEQFIESGDKVAVVLKVRAWPKGSSAAIEIRNGHLWSCRDGKVCRCGCFPTLTRPSKLWGWRSRRCRRRASRSYVALALPPTERT